MRRYPGNNDYPPTYKVVKIHVTSKCGNNIKTEGFAYWSGHKWICNRNEKFRIGHGKVVAWEGD